MRHNETVRNGKQKKKNKNIWENLYLSTNFYTSFVVINDTVLHTNTHKNGKNNTHTPRHMLIC